MARSVLINFLVVSLQLNLSNNFKELVEAVKTPHLLLQRLANKPMWRWLDYVHLDSCEDGRGSVIHTCVRSEELIAALSRIQ